MKVFLISLFSIFSSMTFATNEIWLQDTDCKILSGDGYSVKTAEGSLISSICTRENIVITCSSTSNTLMYGEKPSAIVSYHELVIDKDLVFWKGDSFESEVLLNLKDKRYLASATYFIEGKFLNKYCVGKIINY